ncbi:MAG: thioredoxin family protein [Siphonobacter sp.]
MTLEEFLQSDGCVLMLVFDQYSPTVSQSERVLERFVSQHPQTRLLRVACGARDELFKKYKIQSNPTVLGLRKGREVWRHEGLTDTLTLSQAEPRLIGRRF